MVAQRGWHLCTEIHWILAWSTALQSREFQASTSYAANLCLKTEDTVEEWTVEHHNRGTCRAEPRWERRIPWEQYPEQGKEVAALLCLQSSPLTHTQLKSCSRALDCLGCVQKGRNQGNPGYCGLISMRHQVGWGPIVQRYSVTQRGEGRSRTARQEEAPSRKEAPLVIGAQAGTAQNGKSTFRASHGGHQMAACPEGSWDAFRAWMPSAPSPSAQRQLQQKGRKAYKAQSGSVLLNTPYSAPCIQGHPGLGDVTASWALKGQTHLSCPTTPICDSHSRA